MKRIILFSFLFTIPVFAQTIDPVTTVQEQLKKLERTPLPQVTYETNSSSVFCRVSCRDVKEKDLLYDYFRGVPNAGISANKTTVCVVIPLDPAGFARNQAIQRQQAAARNAAIHQEAAQRMAEREEQVSIAFRFANNPKDYYGKEVVFDCEYEGLDPMIGDWSYELGFAVREKGSRVPCLAFTGQLTGDPITQYVAVGMGAAVKSLNPNDKIRVWGKLVSPTTDAVTGTGHIRRTRPFFVVRNIERL